MLAMVMDEINLQWDVNDLAAARFHDTKSTENECDQREREGKKKKGKKIKGCVWMKERHVCI